MSRSKFVWFQMLAMLASLVITLGIVSIASDTAARAQEQSGPASAAPAEGDADVGARDFAVPTNVSGNCFAAVNSNGTSARTNCVVRTARLASGQYEVIFNGSVQGCTYLATVGTVNVTGIPPGGEISVANRENNANGVLVATRTSGGNLADLPFHLGIFCR
jgi:hypothetical protein